MLRRHMRSAAASSSGRPMRDGGGEEEEQQQQQEQEEENARAIAVSDQRTIYLVNMFIANTVEFLNSFAALCNDKLALLHRKIVKLDSSLTFLEAKLNSIDGVNVLEQATDQKAHGSFIDEERFNPAKLCGESSRSGDA